MLFYYLINKDAFLPLLIIFKIELEMGNQLGERCCGVLNMEAQLLTESAGLWVK